MKYTVYAKTHDETSQVKDPGSSMAIFITLTGKTGINSTRTELDTPTNDFEAGKTDTFHIDVQDVGDIEQILLTCSGGDAWRGEWVDVVNDATGKRWHFPIGEWMSGDLSEGKDQLIIKAH